MEISKRTCPYGEIIETTHFSVTQRTWKKSGTVRIAVAILSRAGMRKDRKKFEIEYWISEGEYSCESAAQAMQKSKEWAVRALKGYREEIDALIEQLDMS